MEHRTIVVMVPVELTIGIPSEQEVKDGKHIRCAINFNKFSEQLENLLPSTKTLLSWIGHLNFADLICASLRYKESE